VIWCVLGRGGGEGANATARQHSGRYPQIVGVADLSSAGRQRSAKLDLNVGVPRLGGHRCLGVISPARPCLTRRVDRTALRCFGLQVVAQPTLHDGRVERRRRLLPSDGQCRVPEHQQARHRQHRRHSPQPSPRACHLTHLTPLSKHSERTRLLVPAHRCQREGPVRSHAPDATSTSQGDLGSAAARDAIWLGQPLERHISLHQTAEL